MKFLAAIAKIARNGDFASLNIPRIFMNSNFWILLIVSGFIDARAMIAASRTRTASGEFLAAPRFAPPLYLAYIGLSIVVEFACIFAFEQLQLMGMRDVLAHSRSILLLAFGLLQIFFCTLFLRMQLYAALGVACVLLTVGVVCELFRILLRVVIFAAAYRAYEWAPQVQQLLYLLHSPHLANIVNYILYAWMLEIVLVRYWPRRARLGWGSLATLGVFVLPSALYLRDRLGMLLPELYQWFASGGGFGEAAAMIPTELLFFFGIVLWIYLSLLGSMSRRAKAAIALERSKPTPESDADEDTDEDEEFDCFDEDEDEGEGENEDKKTDEPDKFVHEKMPPIKPVEPDTPSANHSRKLKGYDKPKRSYF